MSQTMNQPVVVKRVSEVFGINAPDGVTIEVNVDRTDKVPEIDPTYVFDPQKLKRVLQWLDGGFGKNLLLTGPTGCGKSSLIEQVAARLNREVYRVACHGKMEFPELLGNMQLVKGTDNAEDGIFKKAGGAIKALFKGAEDGESLLHWLSRCFSSGVVTQYVLGPAILAAKRNAILLLDEGNFLHPSTFGALNTVLDNGPLSIPETGEVVWPTQGFRIAVTGNSMDGGDDIALHKGVNRMNVALLNRFLSIRCDYMPPLQEAQVIGRTVKLPGPVVEAILEVAKEIRDLFIAGEIETTISTRVLVRWAKLIAAQSAQLPTRAYTLMEESLNFALLDTANPNDASVVQGSLQRIAQGIEQKLVSTGGSNGTEVISVLFVHPNNGSPKIWGGWSEANGDNLCYGELGSALKFEVKVQGYLSQTQNSKTNKGYQALLPLSSTNPKDTIKALQAYYQQIAAGSTVNVPQEIAKVLADLCTQGGKPQLVNSITAV